jgi:site-specific DNA-methyltransferase (adenine-specific)
MATIKGDCIEVLKNMADNSIDSIVTDPPYELNFMGKGWDNTGISYNIELWRECLRVLKPGGHLLAFGGTRTFHRMACVIEDAGFEIRDCIEWLYGSGYPKSCNIKKQLEKTAPSSPEAKKWDGWGSALKPAHEPIVVARKPIEESTIAKNVLKYGTGGINVDGCRIGFINEEDKNKNKNTIDSLKNWNNNTGKKGWCNNSKLNTGEQSTYGRFPANLIIDDSECVRDIFPDKTIKQAKCKTDNKSGWQNDYVGGEIKDPIERKLYLDDNGGSAARFFYCAKTSKRERNMGCEESNKNNHPTVKPISLMSYLIKLVTPPNGIVLDPFMGSGSTGMAAYQLGFDFIGIEKEADHYNISNKRIASVL